MQKNKNEELTSMHKKKMRLKAILLATKALPKVIKKFKKKIFTLLVKFKRSKLSFIHKKIKNDKN